MDLLMNAVVLLRTATSPGEIPAVLASEVSTHREQNKKSPSSKTVKTPFLGKPVAQFSQRHVLVSERSAKEEEFICAKDFRDLGIFIWAWNH